MEPVAAAVGSVELAESTALELALQQLAAAVALLQLGIYRPRL
jgi:hypothetical protein